MLRPFLDYHRATLAMKCDGLPTSSCASGRCRPSTLTLLGLVRHMAEVERTWFRRVIDGEDIPLVWSADDDYQVAYDADRRDPRRGVRRLAGRGRARAPHRARRPSRWT